jgi:threonine/homoserine/homoserine lactone efflux protein
MIEASWLLFIVASLVLIATPGQDMILVMSRSVAQGSRAGVATAAGVSVGLVGHTVLATLGLGAILRTSEWLFLALKLAGAAYLIYLGIGLLRTRGSELTVGLATHRSLRQCFAMARYPIYPTPRSPSSISHSCPNSSHLRRVTQPPRCSCWDSRLPR